MVVCVISNSILSAWLGVRFPVVPQWVTFCFQSNGCSWGGLTVRFIIGMKQMWASSGDTFRDPPKQRGLLPAGLKYATFHE